MTIPVTFGNFDGTNGGSASKYMKMPLPYSMDEHTTLAHAGVDTHEVWPPNKCFFRALAGSTWSTVLMAAAMNPKFRILEGYVDHIN